MSSLSAGAPPGGTPAGRVLRFDRVQRAAHWANALLFGVLMLTALPLYFPGVERLVGRHELIDRIHLWAGVALPGPLVLSLLGPWGRRMRQDVQRISRWTEQEVRWLRTLGRQPPGPLDKFKPGQKLNAIFVAGAMAVLLGTGAVMQWFGPFPVSWRTGATFVHELVGLGVFVVVAGHVYMAFTHPEALRSMIRGWSSEPPSDSPDRGSGASQPGRQVPG